MQIKLDMAALVALFPPDTEARVELQNAVVAEFIRKFVKPSALGLDVQRQVEAARAEVLDATKRGIADAKHAMFKELGVAIPKYGYDNVTLTDQQKASIRNAAYAAISDETKAVFQRYIDERVEKLGPLIEREVDKRVDAAIEQEVKRRFEARLAQFASGA